MQFRKNDFKFVSPSLYGWVSWLLNHFWSLPLSSLGFRVLPGKDVFVVTNAKGFMASYVPPIDTTILMLEAGGFLPEFASAFGLINPTLVLQKLIQYRENQLLPASGNIFIPQSIAQSCSWKESDEIIGLSVCVISNFPWKWKGHELVNNQPSTFSWFKRMTLATPLVLGQVVIFAIPLLIFGLTAFLKAETTLVFSGLLMAIFWNVINGPGWMKGLLVGMVVGLLFGVAGYLFSIPFDFYLKTVVSFLICTLWMSCIYEGTRP